ncbi:MAG: T3SS effector HopA1 family protein [Candidatus Magasanikiibacteriota bacterium]
MDRDEEIEQIINPELHPTEKQPRSTSGQTKAQEKLATETLFELEEDTEQPTTEEDIPPQYRGISAEILEEIWQTSHPDEIEKRQKILEYLRGKEKQPMSKPESIEPPITEQDIPTKYRGLSSEIVQELWGTTDPEQVKLRQKILDYLRQKEKQPLPKTTTNKLETKIKSEREQLFEEQIKNFLQLVLNDKDFRGKMDRFRNRKNIGETDDEFKKRQSLSDVEMLAKMPVVMYEYIHKSGMTDQEVKDEINVPDKENFIANFDTEISNRLIDIVTQSSKVRHITEQELIDGQQPDQAAGFVWFKGNAPYKDNAREVRFYINASPDGTTKVAECLSKLSDYLDQNGIRLKFKFRKDFAAYERTDTCVAYLYIPKAETTEQKTESDQWLQAIKTIISQIPQDAVRKKTSFFTDKIGKGVSFVDDTRKKESKNGESYTSQITKVIAESAKELATQFKDLTPEVIEKITIKTVEKLKQMNYFTN